MLGSREKNLLRFIIELRHPLRQYYTILQLGVAKIRVTPLKSLIKTQMFMGKTIMMEFLSCKVRDGKKVDVVEVTNYP